MKLGKVSVVISLVLLVALGAGIFMLLTRDPAPSVGFQPLYPSEAQLSRLNYSSSEVQSSTEEGTKLVSFTLQGQHTVSFTEQADESREAFKQFSQKKDTTTVNTKWGPATVLYGSFAALHKSDTTIFARASGELTTPEWQSIFNSLTESGSTP